MVPRDPVDPRDPPVRTDPMVRRDQLAPWAAKDQPALVLEPRDQAAPQVREAPAPPGPRELMARLDQAAPQGQPDPLDQPAAREAKALRVQRDRSD